MKTNIDLLLNFIFTIIFTILIFEIVKINKDRREMQVEINELRLLFNQRVLQKMVVTDPEIRDLTYKTSGSKQPLKKFKF